MVTKYKTGRAFLMTLKKTDDIDADGIKTAFANVFDEFCFQEEVGESSSYRHWQLYGCFRKSSAKTLLSVKRLLIKQSHAFEILHLELANHAIAASRYCCKTKTAVSAPIFSSEDFRNKLLNKHNKVKNSNKVKKFSISDASEYFNENKSKGYDFFISDYCPYSYFYRFHTNFLKACCSSYVSLKANIANVKPRTCIFVSGHTGVGKSLILQKIGFDKIFCASDSSSSFPFEGYQYTSGAEITVFDDCNLDVYTLLRISNCGPVRYPVKGSSVLSASKVLLFLSNKTFEDYWHFDSLTKSTADAVRRRFANNIFTFPDTLYVENLLDDSTYFSSPIRKKVFDLIMKEID